MNSITLGASITLFLQQPSGTPPGPPDRLENILIPIIVPLGAFAMVVLLAWLRHRTNEAKLRTQSEAQRQLVEKFGSGKELSEFMETEGGRRFFSNFLAADSNIQRQIERTIRAGVILICAGLGCVALLVRKAEFFYPAVILISLGAGLLIAAAVSLRLSKKWGLIQQEQRLSQGG